MYKRQASLNAALSKTSNNKKESVYVGDNWRDVKAAKNSGIDSVLALYGYIDKNDASLLNPTSSIKKIEDLSNYF